MYHHYEYKVKCEQNYSFDISKSYFKNGLVKKNRPVYLKH